MDIRIWKLSKVVAEARLALNICNLITYLTLPELPTFKIDLKVVECVVTYLPTYLPCKLFLHMLTLNYV